MSYFEPEIEPWAQREMERMGVDIDEYCNIKGYNIDDILTEDDSDD